MMKKACIFDLDDTLFKEVDFLKSGYKAVSKYVEKHFGIESNIVYNQIIAWNKTEPNTFDKLAETYGIGINVCDCLNEYRFHKPNICLHTDVRNSLDALKRQGVILGILTDGRKETQMNKVNALGLTEWINDNMIIINSDKEHFKPNPIGYERLKSTIAEMYKDTEIKITYVGDNPEKDFIYPNMKNWETVCIIDSSGLNIHPQHWDVPNINLPKYKVNSLKELTNLI